jgi:hypothetical protein
MAQMRKSRFEKHRFKTFPLLALASIFFLIEAHLLQAQTVQVDRAQLLQSQTQPPFGPGTTPSGVTDDHAAASPNDTDLGEQQILKRTEEYQPFTMSLGSPIFYTSNVALTNSGEKGDVVIAPVASVYYDPRITKTLYGHFGAREQIFYYGKYDAFNFGSLDAEAGLSYSLPQLHNLVLRAEYDFNRLTSGDQLGAEFFSNHTIILDAEVPFQINRAQRLTLGVDTNLSVGADHQSPRRNDYESYLAYSILLTRAFSIDAAGRVVVRDYHQNNRTDVSEILSGAASYRLTNWCTLSAIGSFAHSDSNHDVFDYNVGNIGGAISLTVKF